jgi:hypothetical protein
VSEPEWVALGIVATEEPVGAEVAVGHAAVEVVGAATGIECPTSKGCLANSSAFKLTRQELRTIARLLRKISFDQVRVESRVGNLCLTHRQPSFRRGPSEMTSSGWRLMTRSTSRIGRVMALQLARAADSRFAIVQEARMAHVTVR